MEGTQKPWEIRFFLPLLCGQSTEARKSDAKGKKAFSDWGMIRARFRYRRRAGACSKALARFPRAFLVAWST